MADHPSFDLPARQPDNDATLRRVREKLSSDSAGRALLDAFRANRAPNTILAYERDLGLFRNWLVASGILDEEVTPVQCADTLVRLTGPEAHMLVLRWLQAMRDEGLSAATIARRVSTLKSLVSLANVLGRCNWRLTVRPPKVQGVKDVRGPSRDSYLRILEEVRRRPGLIGLRDEVLVRLLRDRTLRRSEALSINIEDIDRERRVVQVKRKGHLDMSPVTLAPETMDALLRWVEAWGRTQGPLLVALDSRSHGQRLSGKGAWTIIAGYGEKLGIKVWPHALRHSGTTEALDRGYSIRDVMKLTGHETPGMVMRYDDSRKDVGGQITSDLAEGTSPDDPQTGKEPNDE